MRTRAIYRKSRTWRSAPSCRHTSAWSVWSVLQSPQSDGKPSVEGREQAHCEPATGCGPAGLGSAPAHRRPAKDRRGVRGRGAGSQEKGGAGLGNGRRESERTGEKLLLGGGGKEGGPGRKEGGAREGCPHPVGPPSCHCNKDSAILKCDLPGYGGQEAWGGGG